MYPPPFMRVVVSVVALAFCLTEAIAQGAGDVPGARDPAGVVRYPRSWIVEYDRQQDGAPREFIVTRVDRVRRELRVENLRRVDADQEAATYQVAAGTRLEDIVAHYRAAIGGQLLFSCSGRDCGRSNDWANQVFQQAILYGPDRNQRYLALQREDELVALYVIERGNKRVYAHLRVLTIVGGDPSDAAGLPRSLADQGWAFVPDLVPLPDGQLPENAASSLAGIAGALEPLAGKTLYLVCHLSGSGSAEMLLSASQECADQAATVVNAQLTTTGTRLLAFGAGPLVPRRGVPGSRLEIVDPAYRSSR